MAEKKKAGTIEWLEKEVEVKQLRPFEKNPRRITKEGFERLVDSIKRYGYRARITTTHDYKMIGGHQRIKALKQLGFKKVKILVPSRPLTDAEFRNILLSDNVSAGEHDVDLLKELFPIKELETWGLDEQALKGMVPDAPEDEGEDGKEKKVSFTAKKKDKRVTCPSCNKKFIPGE